MLGNKNDGTFWISYHDFLRRFCSVDVCKAHTGAGWVGESYECSTQGFRESGNNGFGALNGYSNSTKYGIHCNNNSFRNSFNGFVLEGGLKLNDVKSEEHSFRDQNYRDHETKNNYNKNNTDDNSYNFNFYNNSDGNNENENNSKNYYFKNKNNNNSNDDNKYTFTNTNTNTNTTYKKMTGDNSNNNHHNQNDIETAKKSQLIEPKHDSQNKYNSIKKSIIPSQRIVNNVFDVSTENFFIFTVFEPTWIYLSLIQKTKRGKNRSIAHRSYWYSSLAITVFELENEILTEKNVLYHTNLEAKTTLNKNENAKSSHFIKSNLIDISCDSTVNEDNMTNFSHPNDRYAKMIQSNNKINKNNNNSNSKSMRVGEFVACSCHGSVRDSPPLELQLPPGKPKRSS